jgi:hypothetical protein
MNETLARPRADFDLSNTCECSYCATCDMGTEGYTCSECQQATQPLDYCDGACYEYKLEWLSEELDQYLEANGNPSTLQVNGSAMGWQRRSGYATCEADYKKLLDTLTFSGDWTLRFTFDDKNLHVVRYSHDEPTGASFYVVPAAEEGDDE